MSEPNPIELILAKDARYARQAYEFVQLGLRHTLELAGADSGHVSAAQLLDGIRDFAVGQYGPLVRTVLADWGIHATDDIGNIVFNMIDAEVMGKNDRDERTDFDGVYDFEDVFPDIAGPVAIVRATDDDDDDDDGDGEV